MIQRALDATEGLFDRRIVVTRHADVAVYCRERNVDVLVHDLPGRNDTVRLGLEAIGEADGCMFVPGDQPLLRRATVCDLLQNWKKQQEDIWRTQHDGVCGSPVIFPSWAFGELMQLPEGKGGGVLLRKYPEKVRSMDVCNQYELMDADTPEALAMLAGIRENK